MRSTHRGDGIQSRQPQTKEAQSPAELPTQEEDCGGRPARGLRGAFREGVALSQAGPMGEGRTSSPMGTALALAETPQLEPQLQEAMGLEDAGDQA